MLAEERRARLKVESKLAEVINAVNALISNYIPVLIMGEAVEKGFIPQEYLVMHFISHHIHLCLEVFNQ